MTVPVFHLIRPQPVGSIGGADLHVADLAHAQQAGGRWAPTVVAIGNPDYAERLRRSRVPVVTTDDVPALAREVERRLPATGRAVVHSHGYEGDFGAALVRRRHGRDGVRPSFVATAHGWVRTGVVLRAKTVVNHLCLRTFDVVITTSAGEEQRLDRRRGYPRAQFIANGVRFPDGTAATDLRAQLGIDPGHHVVGFVGRPAPEKRPDLFARIAAVVAARRRDVTFVVVGDGPLAGPLARLHDRLGLGDRLVRAGYRSDVDAVFATLDVLVCCSDSEGTPRVVIEAMASDVAVVASRVGGVPSLIDDGRTGRLVPPGDAAAAAAAVLDVLADAGSTAGLRSAARHDARARFHVDRMRDEVDAVYARTLEEVPA